MTNSPMTEARAAELWQAYVGNTVPWEDWYDKPRRAIISLLRAVFDAGREHEREHADPIDPLAENYGKVLRNVKMDSGEEADVAVLSGSIGLLADWSGGHAAKDPHWITDFITDDHTTRYVRHGNTWTAKNPNGNTND